MQDTSPAPTFSEGPPPGFLEDDYPEHVPATRPLNRELRDIWFSGKSRDIGHFGKTRVQSWKGFHGAWGEIESLHHRHYTQRRWENPPEPWLDIVHQHDMKEDLPRSVVIEDLRDRSTESSVEYYDPLERVIIRPNSVRLMSREQATWAGRNTGMTFRQLYIRFAFLVPCTRKVCAVRNEAFYELVLNHAKLDSTVLRDGWTGAGTFRIPTVLRCKCGVHQCITFFVAGTMHYDSVSKESQWTEWIDPSRALCPKGGTKCDCLCCIASCRTGETFKFPKTFIRINERHWSKVRWLSWFDNSFIGRSLDSLLPEWPRKLGWQLIETCSSSDSESDFMDATPTGGADPAPMTDIRVVD